MFDLFARLFVCLFVLRFSREEDFTAAEDYARLA